MKTLLRNTLFNAFSIFLISQLISGMRVYGGLLTYIIAGLVLTLLMKLLKPILNLLALPLNIITLGLFSFVINVIIFYVLTVLVVGITISAFILPDLSFAGITISSRHIDIIFAFVIVSILQSVVVSFLTWLMKK